MIVLRKPLVALLDWDLNETGEEVSPVCFGCLSGEGRLKEVRFAEPGVLGFAQRMIGFQVNPL